jgi:choline dehydrogenase-like flavoprotein
MIKDAWSLSNGDTIAADVCIVGSGPAGMTVALELIGSGLSVVLLEGGGVNSEPESNALDGGQNLGLGRGEMRWCRSRRLGGTSDRWVGWCRPRSEESLSDWPLTGAELEPLYRRAHLTLELGEFNYDSDMIADRIGRSWLPLDAGRVERVVYQFSPPTHFGSRYRSDLESADNITTWLHANVLAIEAAGSTVTGLRCATTRGVDFRVEASRYVMACGGIENARLLLASGVGDPQWVGYGFMEHPHYEHGAAIMVTADADLAAYRIHEAELGALTGAPTRVRFGFGLSRSARAAEGILPFAATLIKDENVTTGLFSHNQLRGLIPDAPSSRLRWLEIRSEQTVVGESRVGLSADKDAFGMPLTTLDWRIFPQDTARLVRGLELLGAELGRAGVGRLYVPLHEDGSYAAKLSAGCHHMGTTRIGEPGDGAVDADGLVHGVDNLYVAGSSLFRSAGFANPTLTIVALAHGLADHLKERS